MLKSDKTNAKVADFFKVSVATVNNHRTRLKREELIFPSKRGRRPKQMSDKKDVTLAISKIVSTKMKIVNYNFINNGVVVTVSGIAKMYT